MHYVRAGKVNVPLKFLPELMQAVYSSYFGIKKSYG